MLKLRNPPAFDSIPFDVSFEYILRNQIRPLALEEAYLTGINHFIELRLACPEDASGFFDCVEFRDVHWIPSLSLICFNSSGEIRG